MSTSELFPLQHDEHWDLSHHVNSLVVVDSKTLKTTLRPRLVGLLSGSGSSRRDLPNELVVGAVKWLRLLWRSLWGGALPNAP